MSHRMKGSITRCNSVICIHMTGKKRRLRQSHRGLHVVRSGSITSLLTVLEQFQLIGCRNVHDFICTVLYEHLTVSGPTLRYFLETLKLSRFES